MGEKPTGNITVEFPVNPGQPGSDRSPLIRVNRVKKAGDEDTTIEEKPQQPDGEKKTPKE